MPPILGCSEKNKVQKKHPKTDWLTVEDVQVHKWMKKKVPDSKESGSGIIRVAFCSMFAVLCAWVIASSRLVRRPWTGLGISRVSPVVRPIQP